MENISTQGIVSLLRYALLYRNISQRQFSKLVLNRSQGTLSAIMKNPKPWSELTSRGRQIYYKILSWLLGYDVNYALDTIHRKTSIKYKFNQQQKDVLSYIFQSVQYLNAAQTQGISQAFGVPANSITNWFKNQRSRSKLVYQK